LAFNCSAFTIGPPHKNVLKRRYPRLLAFGLRRNNFIAHRAALSGLPRQHRRYKIADYKHARVFLRCIDAAALPTGWTYPRRRSGNVECLVQKALMLYIAFNLSAGFGCGCSWTRQLLGRPLRRPRACSAGLSNSPRSFFFASGGVDCRWLAASESPALGRRAHLSYPPGAWPPFQLFQYFRYGEAYFFIYPSSIQIGRSKKNPKLDHHGKSACRASRNQVLKLAVPETRPGSTSRHCCHIPYSHHLITNAAPFS